MTISQLETLPSPSSAGVFLSLPLSLPFISVDTPGLCILSSGNHVLGPFSQSHAIPLSYQGQMLPVTRAALGGVKQHYIVVKEKEFHAPWEHETSVFHLSFHLYVIFYIIES